MVFGHAAIPRGNRLASALQPTLTSIALRSPHDQRLVEDAVQATFLRLSSSISRATCQPPNLKALIPRILRKVLIDLARSRSCCLDERAMSLPLSESEPDQRFESHGDQAISREDREGLRQCLAKLSPEKEKRSRYTYSSRQVHGVNVHINCKSTSKRLGVA